MTDIDLKEKIDSFIIEQMINNNSPGISIGIIKDGETFYSRGYGFRDVVENQAMTADTLYGIGSTTKPMTAIAVMQLVEKGELRLDDPISKYLDFDIGLGDTPITVHHLLSHTSGIQDLGICTKPFSWHLGDLKSFIPISSSKDFLKVVNMQKKNVRFNPGEIFMYNNDMYYILGLLIETITGKDFEDHIQTNILDPLRMQRTSFEKTKITEDSDHITGYMPKGDNNSKMEMLFSRFINAPGGVLSSANEMLKFTKSLLAKEKQQILLKPISIKTMWQPVIPCSYSSTGDGFYGYGWINTSFLGNNVISHGGNVGTSSSALMMLPEKEMGIVVGQNKDNALPGTIAAGLIALLEGHDPKKVVPTIQVNNHLKPILGNYSNHMNENKVTVSLKSGALHLDFQSDEEENISVCLEVINLEKFHFKLSSVFPKQTLVQFHVDKENPLQTYFQVDRQIFFWKGYLQ